MKLFKKDMKILTLINSLILLDTFQKKWYKKEKLSSKKIILHTEQKDDI
jgi:hypothetical protein